MNFTLLENLVKSGLFETLIGFDWIRADVIARFDSERSSGIGLVYFDRDMVKKEPFYQDNEGLWRVREMATARNVQRILSEYYVECKQDLAKRWNNVTITIYPDGRYESAFFWNNAAELEREISKARAAIGALSDSLIERVAFEIKPEVDWKSAVATVIIRDGKIDDQSYIVLEGDPTRYPLNLDGFWQREFPAFHQKTNAEPLKNHFPAWNTLVYQLYYMAAFNPDRDLQYQLNPLA